MAATEPPGRRPTLSQRIADDIRSRLASGEWAPGAQLPTEHELAEAYGVSRSTVRTALRALDGRGFITTVHGLGTFATAASVSVAADVSRLESISETIVRMGRIPRSTYRSIALGEAAEAEATALSIPKGSEVLVIQREIMADEEVVAYSHDVVPRAHLAEDFSLTMVEGSMFSLLEKNGVHVTRALSSMHASDGREIGWGDHRAGSLFLRLDQAHFDDRSRGVAFSRSWFVEGRFQFSLVRAR